MDDVRLGSAAITAASSGRAPGYDGRKDERKLESAVGVAVTVWATAWRNGTCIVNASVVPDDTIGTYTTAPVEVKSARNTDRVRPTLILQSKISNKKYTTISRPLECLHIYCRKNRLHTMLPLRKVAA